MARLPLLLVWLALLLVGCPQPATNTDAAADSADKPAPDALEAPDLVVVDAPLRDRPDVPSIDAPDVIERPDALDAPDARPDRTDASLDRSTDVRRDVTGLDAEVPQDAGGDRPDVDDLGSLDASLDFLEIGPDPYGDCTVPRFDVPDAEPLCSPESMSGCVCVAGPTGYRICLEDRTWSACQCPPTDAGLRDVGGSMDADAAVPSITGPRLLAPQSGSRATSRRPTLRWRLPVGVTRARLELCSTRSCDPVLSQRDITGESWRSAELLAPGVVFWRVQGLDASGLVTWSSATWEFGVPRRDTPVDTSYGVLKDFNGDGYDDVVVESRTRLPPSGLRVFLGGTGGLDGARVRFVDPPPPPLWEPDRASISEFGQSFSVGDLNGDGLADLVVGDYLYDELPYFARMDPAADGRIYVFFGARDCVLARYETSYRPRERGRPYQLGNDVSVGDFNGDGYGDMLGTNAGGRYGLSLYLGGPQGPSDAPIDISSIGSITAQFVGDVNGDGYADILARDGSEYALVVVYGNPGGILEFHVQHIALPFPAVLDGWLILGGDINEDRYADALVGTDGRVYVLYGSSEGIRRVRLLPTPPGTEGGIGPTSFGIGLALADLDGDGHAEMLAGAAAANDADGQVYVFSSATGDLSDRWSQTIPGPFSQGQQFSRAAIPGDVDGDAFNDVAIGAPNDRTSDRGRLYFYAGGGEGWWARPPRAFEGRGEFGNNVQ